MLKLAGGTVLVIGQRFFRMQKAGGQGDARENEQEYQIEIFFTASFHNPFFKYRGNKAASQSKIKFSLLLNSVGMALPVG